MNDQRDQKPRVKRSDSRIMTDLASAWKRWLSLPEPRASTPFDDRWVQHVELCCVTVGVAGREIRRCLEADATAAELAEVCATLRDSAVVLLGLLDDTTNPTPPPRKLRLVEDTDADVDG